MVYTFRILSHEEKDFVRDFEIHSEQTFFDFHNAIQDELRWDKSQMASFIFTNDKWEKEGEINLFDMSEDGSSDLPVMHKAVLKEFLQEERQKMLYVHDFFSERAFFIELAKITEETKDKKYPFCTRAEGRTPQQILIEDNNIDNILYGEFEDEDSDEDIRFENIDDYGEF
ncbi:hypothetical protein ES705_27994 [subsurface metagenome]